MPNINEELEKGKKIKKQKSIVAEQRNQLPAGNLNERKVNDNATCSQDMITMVTKMLSEMKDFGC